jgi:hypothetical protein
MGKRVREAREASDLVPQSLLRVAGDSRSVLDEGHPNDVLDGIVGSVTFADRVVQILQESAKVIRCLRVSLRATRQLCGVASDVTKENVRKELVVVVDVLGAELLYSGVPSREPVNEFGRRAWNHSGRAANGQHESGQPLDCAEFRII